MLEWSILTYINRNYAEEFFDEKNGGASNERHAERPAGNAYAPY